MSKRPTKRAAPAPPAPPAPDPYPMTFETFRQIDGYDRRQLESGQPACFNGFVRVERYRVTIERIEEPVEVIHARILKLWRESENCHDRSPLLRVAKEYGLDLTGIARGCDRGTP